MMVLYRAVKVVRLAVLTQSRSVTDAKISCHHYTMSEGEGEDIGLVMMT